VPCWGEESPRTERGNALHDCRDRIYRSIGKLVDTPRGALLFLQDYIDRTEGRPTKRVEKTVHPSATFVFTNPDGTTRPALPEKVDGGATPGAASEDAIILGLDLEPVRI